MSKPDHNKHYYSYLIMPGTGDLVRSRIIRQDQIDDDALTSVENCINTGDWSHIRRNTGLRVRHTREPVDFISIYHDARPIAVAMYLTEPSPDALLDYSRTIVSMYRHTHGIEPSAEWMELVLDFPATIECAIPAAGADTPAMRECHAIAGAIIMVWGYALARMSGNVE